MRFRKQVEKEYFETKERLEQLERELAQKYRRKNRYDKDKEIENSEENYTFYKLTSKDIRTTIITNLNKLLEETEDENNNTFTMQKQEEQSTDSNK